MTDAPPAATDRALAVDPGLAAGRSKLLTFAGMAVLAVGALLGAGTVVWAGVVAILAAFALNTVGKLLHYRDLDVPGRDWLLLAASWLAVAVTTGGLLVTYAHARYGPGESRIVLTLGVAGLGFGLLHMAAQSKLLPLEAVRDADE